MPHTIQVIASLPSFGKRLKRLRRIKALKQEAVAAMAGVNQATVSRWERGSITPSEKTIQALLQALALAPAQDTALQRLVQHCALPTHLITDVDHRLLAASHPVSGYGVFQKPICCIPRSGNLRPRTLPRPSCSSG